MGIHTLHLEHVVLLALYTLLTVANSFLYKGTRGIHWFSLYNLFALMGALSVALRGQISPFLSIVVGNVFVMVAYLLLFLSLSEMFGRKRGSLFLQMALVLAGVLTMVQYGMIHPDTKNRLIAYSVVLGLQQVHIAFFLSRREDGTVRMVGIPMVVMVASLAATNLVRTVGVLWQGAPADYLNAGSFLSWIVIVNSCLQCGAMVAYVWLTAALLRQDLEQQATTDPLTGLLNRRAIERLADRLLAEGRGGTLGMVAVTIDLDGFKKINDTFGHSCGDATLAAVAECLRRNLRRSDALARVGGDEFAMLLPRTTNMAALAIAEGLRGSLESMEIAHGLVRTRITASFGLADGWGADSDWDRLVTRCDLALYEAKKEGGNRVVLAAGALPARVADLE